MGRCRALYCLAILGMLMACAPGRVSDESRQPQPVDRSVAEGVSPTALLASTGDGSIPIPESLADPLRSRIAAREYWASETERGLQAPNRENDFRVWFGAEGVRVDDRDAKERMPLVELALAAIGRGDRLTPVPKGAVSHDASRVEIARPELGVVEWFENTEEGLEQGFTLQWRPGSLAPRSLDSVSVVAAAGEPQNRPTGDSKLVIDLAVEGARASLGMESVTLDSATGRRLRYGALSVVDARGIELAARFEVPSHDRIRIVVDDRAATYPIVVDPLLTRTADTQIESNQVNGLLGYHAASAGDVNGDGYEDVIASRASSLVPAVVYIHHGGPTGVASGGLATAATVLTMTQFTGDLTVASAGDVNGDGYDDVIVGAHEYDSGQGYREGAAFVYLGGPSGVASGNESTAATRLEGNQASASFGRDVASAGDVNGDGHADVIVGAWTYDNGQTDEGAAFVYLGSAAGIPNGSAATAHARLESNQTNAFLGLSVASAGDVNGDGYSDVIVGAPQYDDGEIGEGAAFAFLGSASGIANGDPVTAHARLQSNQALAGSALVASLGDIDGDGFGDVGFGVSRYGGGKGAVFVFKGSATGLVADGSPANAATSLINTTPGVNICFPGNFGDGLAAGDLNGDGYSDLMVGAPSYSLGQDGEGAVFTFFGSATGIHSGSNAPLSSAITIESNQTSTCDAEGTYLVGLGLAIDVGDTNGDGYGDLIAGLQRYTVDQSNEGAVFVYHGGSRRPVTPAWGSLQSLQVASEFGFSIAAAGDVNGDGYGDVIVGAPDFDDGQADEGAAFVFHGSASGFQAGGSPATANGFLTSDQSSSGFGRGVASAGDVNGDGFGDVVVGAPFYDNGETDEGAAFVYLGSSTGIGIASASTAHARIEANQVAAALGISVASAGDVNGDGFGDVIVGASEFDSGELDEGAAFIFHGAAAGLGNASPATAATMLQSNQAGLNNGTLPFPNPSFGLSAGAAGDVNGDGYGDIIVGSPGYIVQLSPSTRVGSAYLFLGSASGVASSGPATAHARIESNGNGSVFLGTSVGTAGDVNGDGFADVAVASTESALSLGFVRAKAHVFLGSPTGLANATLSAAHAILVADSERLQPTLASVASVGDVNLDGYADVSVTATRVNSSPGVNHSATQVYRGSATGFASVPAAYLFYVAYFGLVETHAADLVAGGDFNGDGWSDILLGAPVGEVALIFPGNEDPGRVTLLRQLRGDGSGIPVQPDSGAYSNTSFVVELTAHSAIGRERAKVEVETCPVGLPFDHPSCLRQTSPTWIDLGTTGATISQTVVGLSAHTSYSWRARMLTIPFSASQPGIVPVLEKSVWYRLGGRATAGDVRTVPEPGVGPALVVGGALAGLLARRRFPREARELVPHWKIEVEYCPGASAVFGGPGCLREVSPSWTDLGTSGSIVSRTIPGLVQGTPYVWRARARYASYRPAPPGPSVDGVAGPWFRVQARPRAADIRIGAPEPGVLVSLAVGGLAIAGGAKRRRSRGRES